MTCRNTGGLDYIFRVDRKGAAQRLKYERLFIVMLWLLETSLVSGQLGPRAYL